jgi:putative oxidoreductase
MTEQAKLLLRVLLAALLLFHGIAKLLHGLGPIPGLVARMGLPPQLAYFVFVGEIVAPLLLLVGVWTRAAALLVACNMVVALTLVHRGDFLKLSSTGGWQLELQAFYLFVALAILMLGAGRYSVGGSGGRFN